MHFFKNLSIQTKLNLASLILGALLPLAFAPVHLYFLAFAVPALLLWIWRQENKKQVFFNGWLFGFGFFFVGISWIYVSLHTYGNVPFIVAGLLTVLFIALLSLLFAVQGFIFKFFPEKIISQAFLSFPFLWILFEWIRSWLFTGLPWLFLGYSQTTTIVGAFAPIFGVYGVSLFVLWLSGAIITFFLDKRFKSRFFSIGMIIFILVVGGILYTGIWTKPAGKSIKVSLIQGDIPLSVKWQPEQLTKTLTEYYNLTQQHWTSAMIIWPEAAIPAPSQMVFSYLDAIKYLAEKNHSVIITGIPVVKTLNGKLNDYNGLVTIGEKNPQVYLKRHLVPFGEYMPLRPIFGWFLKDFQIPLGDQTPGDDHQAPFIVNHIQFAPFICYEIAYPNEVLNHLQNANMMVVVTDDAWFGHSLASSQHLQIAQMRALETGRYLLFATNSGITAIINPKGEIIKQLPANT
ncbi:MAG: apolipoprotein N-acyltransferase, partial [Gammaproteobacteria bacterium RIFOXYB2_FULL_38_6]